MTQVLTTIFLLLSLARAYFATAKFDPENLTRAEATLQELMANVDASADVVRATSISYCSRAIADFAPFIAPRGLSRVALDARRPATLQEFVRSHDFGRQVHVLL